MKDPHGLPKGLLRGLQAEHLVIRRAAVEEAFRYLGQHSAYQSRDGAALLQQCLSATDAATVEEAVQQLVAFVPRPGLDVNDGIQLMLATLSTSGSATAPQLVEGIVNLFHKSSDDSLALSRAPAGHPLYKTLLAHPSAAQQLLVCLGAAFAGPDAPQAASASAQWLLWEPFLSLALLDHGEGACRLPFAMQLHAALMRCLEGSGCSADVGKAILNLLICLLPCLPLKAPQQRAWAAACAAAPLQLCAQHCHRGDHADNSQKAVAASLHLCFELTRHGDSIIGIQPGLASVLQTDVAMLHACLPSMALLAQISPRNTADAIMDHILGLCSSLDSLSPGVKGLLQMPLVTSIAFGWPCHAHKARPVMDWLTAHASTRSSPAMAQAQSSLYGQPASVSAATAVLETFFQPYTGPPEALQWLRSVRGSFAASSATRALLGPLSMSMLCALLEHSAADVQISAAQTMAAAARAVPTAGISFLPVLVHHLQRLSMQVPTSGLRQHADVELALMQAIPAMAYAASCLPYVNRVLDQLCPPDAPERLRAISLQLHCKLWKDTGHSFNRLRDLLMPDASQLRLSHIMAVTKAATQKEVCLHDVDRGMQLMEGIQALLPSKTAGAAALALEALGILCERGGISFRDAWKLLRGMGLQRPEQELQRAAWATLLGQAHSIAEEQAEQAAAHHTALWEAAQDSSARVRSAAYGAMACWGFEMLELLEVQKPPRDYSGLLLWETDGEARGKCEALVISTLAYEHARRRRHVGPAAKPAAAGRSVGAAGSAAEGATLKRLTRLVPKELLDSASDNPGVLLLLWAPAKRAARSGDGRAEFAAAAAQEYAAKCEEILSQAGPADAEVPPCLKFQSWRCFLGRWRAALTAAAAQTGSAHEEEIMHQTCAQIWDIMKASLSGSGPETCQAAQAAAALHGLTATSDLQLSRAIQAALQELSSTCRSQTIAQAVRSSLSEVTPSSQEQQSVPVEAFLRELHAAVDSLQDCRTRAGEAVAQLEQLPGAVLSGNADHAVVDAEAQWLMSVASSSALPGRCVGAASAALGCVLGAAVASRPDAPGGAAAGALSQGLAALRAAAGNAPRLSQSSAARVGVAKGLAAALGAPHMLPGVDTGSAQLLRRAAHEPTAKQALQMLESLAGQDAAGSARQAAAWCLAAAAAAGRAASRGAQSLQAGKSAQGASIGHAALAALPADSAMKALVEHLAGSSSAAGLHGGDASGMAASCKASVLRCLAAAERLPHLDWGNICGPFLRGDASGSDACATAAVGLLVRHFGAPGCSDLWMEVMQGPRFKKLPSKARQQLLESCGAVLRNAGEAMQEQITKSLPSLADGELAASAWRGIHGCIAGKAKEQAPVVLTACMRDTMQRMIAALPLPVHPSPGVEDWLLNGQSHEHSSPTADTADMPQEWVQWRAALHALAALTEAQACSMMSRVPRPQSCQEVFATAMLVHHQRLPAEHLAQCRTWCMSMPEMETMGLSATVARASVLSPESSQAQLLLQLLNVRQVFPDAAGPVLSRPCIELAALFVAGLAASMHRDAVWAHVAMHSGATALHQMSDALPRVLQESFVQRSASLLVQSLYTVHEHPACDPQLQKLILHCCLAVRDDMDAAGIRELSVVATRASVKTRK